MTWYEPHADWTYADRRLIITRCIVLWAFMLFVIADFVVFGILFSPAWAWAAGAALLLGAWFTWIIYRSVTAHTWSASPTGTA